LVGFSAGFRVKSYSYLFLTSWRNHHTSHTLVERISLLGDLRMVEYMLVSDL